MDAIVYAHSAKQEQRIKKIINDPDSTSGVLTVPKVIATGETITIPAGRVAILPDIQVDGDLVVDGDLFIPSGSTYTATDINVTNATFDTLKVQGKNVSPFTGFKNYIINGCMRIAQRGAGPFTANGYGIDQWFSYISATTSNIIRIWNGTGSNHPSYAQVTVGAGIDIVTMEHRIESPHRFSNKTLTLSMMLFNGSYNGSNIPYEIALMHSAGRASLFTGNLTFNSTSRIAVTFTIPDLSSYTLNSNSYLEIRPVNILNKGYTGVFGIRDVQLEEGSVATPFEQRPYGLELSLCQRYYETGQTKCYIAASANGMTLGNNFKVTKRVTPSMVTTGGLYQPVSYEEISNEFFRANRTTGNEMAFYWTASAEL